VWVCGPDRPSRAAAILIYHGEDSLLVLDIALHLKLIDEPAEAVEVELADLVL